jgi:hypothetical protein
MIDPVMFVDSQHLKISRLTMICNNSTIVNNLLVAMVYCVKFAACGMLPVTGSMELNLLSLC